MLGLNKAVQAMEGLHCRINGTANLSHCKCFLIIRLRCAKKLPLCNDVTLHFIYCFRSNVTAYTFVCVYIVFIFLSIKTVTSNWESNTMNACFLHIQSSLSRFCCGFFFFFCHQFSVHAVADWWCAIIRQKNNDKGFHQERKEK